MECDGEYTDLVAVRREQIAALSAAEYEALEAANVAGLAALPIVNPHVKLFRYGRALNQQGVQVNLNCAMGCGCHRQPRYHCRRDVPTRAHAAELLLHSLTENHAECIADRTRWQDGAASNAAASTAPTALSHITGVQRRASEVLAAQNREKGQHQATLAAKAALQVAQAAELKSVQDREMAEVALA